MLFLKLLPCFCNLEFLKQIIWLNYVINNEGTYVASKVQAYGLDLGSEILSDYTG